MNADLSKLSSFSIINFQVNSCQKCILSTGTFVFSYNLCFVLNVNLLIKCDLDVECLHARPKIPG